MLYADIAVALPIDHLYTYLVPDEFQDDIAIGKRVLMSFGRKQMTGYVVRLSSSTDVPNVKELLDILDAEPVVTPEVLQLTKWIAEYYLCAWGIALKAALPSGIDVEQSLKIRVNRPDDMEAEAASAFFEEAQATLRGTVQKKILSVLRQHGTMSLRELQKKSGKNHLHSSLYALERQGLICIERQMKAGRVKAKTMQHVALKQSPAMTASEMTTLEKRASQQAAVIKFLQSIAPKDIAIAELQKILGFETRSPIKALQKKDYVEVYEKEVRRKPLGAFEYQSTTHLALTAKQQEALERIVTAIDSGEFSPILLHGITGSGKTEIYLQAIAYVLTRQRKALVLVPEISLTPLLVGRFLSRFGERIAVLHSALSIGERLDEWQRIRRDDVDVVIGARSAIFAPIANLGLIVVDEEHEMSYKQDTLPRYHGRDTAVMRARFQEIPIILGSATPSLESYYNTQEQKYQLLTIAERIDHRPLPLVEIIDLRHEEGKPHIISNLLEQALREVLSRGEQAILFLNLRGFANFYLCKECGFVYECPRCSVTLTYHADSRRLQCHYCDFSRLPPMECDHCHSTNVQYRGFGTERVEQEMQLLFPDVAIARMDRDTVSGKHGHYKVLRRFERHEIDILIGTQMITKGHDFPNVTLVGVVAAETALHLPDFRASERTFQILTQVAGRTGRGALGGEVIIQTYTPTHYAIRAAQTHDYMTFYAREIMYRKHLNYPPFSRVVNILLQGSDEDFTREAARHLAEHLRAIKHKELTLLGPSPAAFTKLRNKYRFQILLKSTYSTYMRQFVKQQIEAFRKLAHLKDVQIHVDVDPVNLL